MVSDGVYTGAVHDQKDGGIGEREVDNRGLDVRNGSRGERCPH